jgi:hypothetical protein
MGRLTRLTCLYRDDNQLTGTIPTELGRLTDLETLEMNLNSLNGAFPRAICSFSYDSSLNVDH